MIKLRLTDNEARDRAIVARHQLFQMADLFTKQLQPAPFSLAQWRIIAFHPIEQGHALFAVEQPRPIEQLVVEEGVNPVHGPRCGDQRSIADQTQGWRSSAVRKIGQPDFLSGNQRAVTARAHAHRACRS